jgi:hypothetical protein
VALPDSHGKTPSTSDFPWIRGTGYMWSRWWGSPELVARASRVAAEQLKNDDDGQVLEIDVFVKEDIEHFDSANAFLEQVTDDALRHWHLVLVSVETSDVSISVRFLRRRISGRRLLEYEGGSAVVLTVLLMEGASDDVDIESVRDAVGRALERARPFGSVPRRVHAWDAQHPGQATLGPDWITMLLLWCTFGAISFVVVIGPGGSFPLAASIVLGLAASFIGTWAVRFVDDLLVGKVTISTGRRGWQRFAFITNLLAIPAISAAVGLLVKYALS